MRGIQDLGAALGACLTINGSSAAGLDIAHGI